MKVNKKFPGVASDIAVGDYVNGHGTVVFVGRNSYGEVLFSYLDDYGVLCSELYDTGFKVTLIREVETPYSVDIETKYGDTLRVGCDSDEDIWLDVLNPDGTARLGGRIVSAHEVIDAIKTVKGLD